MWWMILTVKHGDRNRPEYPGSASRPGAGLDRGKPRLPAENADGQRPERVSLALAQWAEEHGV